MGEAFVTVHKRPSLLVVLPTNSEGEIRTSGLPVERLVAVNQLAEVRERLLVRPLRQFLEVQPDEAIHQTGGQMPQVPVSLGGGMPYPRHIYHPLCS